MITKWPPVPSPFKDGDKIYLNTGERGTAYTDGWGNMAYRKDDGVVYLYFLPYRAQDLNRVRQLPITDFQIQGTE